MSFGSKQYQHRFYHNNSHKKDSGISTYNSSAFPLISSQSQQFPEYYPSQINPLTNQINIRTRAGPLKANDPGWDGYRLKSYIIDQYAKDYQQNAETLERFRRQAEEYRRRVRFGSQDHRYALSRLEQSHISGLYRQLQDNKAKIQQLKHSMVYNPEALRHYRDLDVKYRLDSIERDRNNMISRLEINDSITRRKLKDYKQKYSKLKSKLKEEMLEKQKEQLQNWQRKQVKAIEKQSGQLEGIQKMLSSISTGLQHNSQLIWESMKLNSQISMRSPSLDKSVANTKPMNELGVNSFIDDEKEVLSEEEEDKEDAVRLPKLSPKIVYTKKKLDSQYKELQNLKKYIQTVDNRIKRLKTE